MVYALFWHGRCNSLATLKTVVERFSTVGIGKAIIRARECGLVVPAKGDVDPRVVHKREWHRILGLVSRHLFVDIIRPHPVRVWCGGL